MISFFKNNGLTIVLLVMFALTICGHFNQGYNVYNEERVSEDHLSSITKSQYLTSGHFLSSLSENMESEFLQMALYVYLTRWLYQRGSAESKKQRDEKTPQELKEEDEEKKFIYKKRMKHPFWWWLYENSLTIVFMLLFFIFFFLHAHGTMENINLKKLTHNKKTLDFWHVFSESEFWFESFQNWQSEFFSIASMVFFSIFLRQKHSAQSKKMNAAHSKTGTD